MNQSNRPMRSIYLKAASIAMSLKMRANKLEPLLTDREDQLHCAGLAYSCRLFHLRATQAADTILTLMNDGTLKQFCSEFDKVFDKFVADSVKIESILDALERKVGQ